MEDCHGWAKLGMKGLRGATVGLLSGGAVAGAVAIAIGIALETADGDLEYFPSTETYLFGISANVWFFVGMAMFAAPGCIIAGAAGAICRQALVRQAAGFAGGLLPTGFLSYQLWLCDDVPGYWHDWPYTFLIIGGGSLVGALVAGAIVSWRSQTDARYLPTTQ